MAGVAEEERRALRIIMRIKRREDGEEVAVVKRRIKDE